MIAQEKQPGAPAAFINARIVDPANDLDIEGGLIARDGIISVVGREVTAQNIGTEFEVVDCDGQVLAPGLIDMRVFVGEPGAEHKGTMASTSQSAAAGGITTIVTMPNTDPVIDEVALVGYVRELARASADIRVHPMAALTKGLKGSAMSEMGMLREAGAVAFSDGDNAIADSMVMRRILSYARAHDLLVCPFPEDRALAAEGVMNEGEIAMRLGLAGVPTQAETIMIERDLRLLELTNARYHAALVSTKDAIDAIRRARARGLKVTAAAAPYNFALNDMSVVPYRTFAKTKPPLRSEADREALVQALADGTIDVICSSDQPEDPESKRQPFAQAEFGVIGLETLLPISLELYHNGALSLSDTLAKLTVAPARLLNLPSGTLSPGEAADLVLFDPARPWVIDALKLLSKSKNTPFDGKPTQGKVLRTVVAGRTIFEAKE